MNDFGTMTTAVFFPFQRMRKTIRIYGNLYFGFANTKPPIGSLWFPFAKYGKMEKN
jgi:hypothetical protein